MSFLEISFSFCFLNFILILKNPVEDKKKNQTMRTLASGKEGGKKN